VLAGFFRNTVSNDVSYNGNKTQTRRNEVATNTIGGDLSCNGNSPAPQVRTRGAPNAVSATCAASARRSSWP
jgi:hypothetical protein